MQNQIHSKSTNSNLMNPSMMNGLSEPVILVTGAGKGIGRSVVEEIISRKNELNSPRLFLTSRTESDLKTLKAMAEGSGLKCEIFANDLADGAAELPNRVEKAFGRLDVLIHSAGVGRFADFLQLTLEDLQWVMKTNVEATFSLLQKSYSIMRKQKSGQIQVITSVAAERPFEQSAIYCMSKFAQKGLLEVMRLYAYRDGIRICEVKPGAAFTPMWGEIPLPMKDKMMASKDVAQAMVHALQIPMSATIEEITIRPLHGDLESTD